MTPTQAGDPRRRLAGLFLWLALAPLSSAQDVSGAIAGNITDPTGAAIPRARVTLTNTDRNQVVRAVTTDSGGNYSAPLLSIGTYSLEVDAAGFKKEVRTGIVLNVRDDLKVNLVLAVGDRAETITVQEDPVGPELGTPASSTTIEGEQVRELSLGTRNYEQLVSLMPGVSSDDTDQLYIGVSSPSGLALVLPYSINGQRNSANNWAVDGGDNVDRGSNLTLINHPSVDAISQFKVSRSAYSADAGRAGGGQISVVTKGGVRQYHGGAYEFIRNDAFSANNWINNANRVNVVDGKAKAPPLRWNNFGFNLGGPLYLPRRSHSAKSKTFFYYSQEFRRIVNYRTFSPVLPTAAQTQGNFSLPVCIALQGGTCTQTATSIPNMNAVAATYIKDIWSQMPLPSSGNTIFVPTRLLYDHSQEMARIDQSFTQGFSVWGRLIYDSIPTVEPGGLFTGSAIPNGATTSTNAPGLGLVLHAVNTIRTTLLNESGYSLSRGAINSRPIGLTAKSNATDVNVNLPYPSTLGVVPAIVLTGGSTLLGKGPYDEYSRNHNAFDNLTWIKGRHTVKAGVSVNRYQKTENAAGNNYGTMSFTNTGVPRGTDSFSQAWANFLLGNVATFTQDSLDITPNLWAWQTETFAQDDFRVRKNLSLSLGLRWSYFGQPVDARHQLDNFDPGSYAPADAPQINTANGQIVAGTGKAANGIIIAGHGSPFGDNVSNNNYHDFAPRLGLSWDPFQKGKMTVRAGYGVYRDSTLFGTYEQNMFVNPPLVQSINISNSTLQNPSGGTVNVSLSPVSLHATQIPNHTPYTQHWSFDLQRQFRKGIFVDAGYFGSKGTHLLGLVDINEAPPGLALASGLKTGTGTIFTSTDTARINAVRPYRGYGPISALENAFDSNYHSLQIHFRKSFPSAGLFSLAYTWSHNLTDNPSDRSNAPQNSYNWHGGEYGPASLDRRQILTFNYVYNVPEFRWAKGAARATLRGWEFSGITSYGTGLPYTSATSNADPAGLGIIGSSPVSIRPDQVCDPNLDAPHTLSQWFNTGCFAPVPQGVVRPGNAGRGTIRGPGYGKWDVTLLKNFRMGERVKLQLRGETFNILNHPNPSGVGSTNITSAQYGRITSFRDPRLIQLAAKLNF